MKLQTLLEQIAKILVQRGWKLSVAESCTGGLIGEYLTLLPGSSRFFVGGIIAYSPESKIRLLQVDASLIDALGSVNEEVAKQMALGAKNVFHTDWALSVTGVAGPEPTNHQPVGTIFIGLVSPNGASTLNLHLFPTFREKIRRKAAHSALIFLLNALESTISARSPEQQ